MGELILVSDEVSVGGHLEFAFTLEAKEDIKLMVDYIVYFRTKVGKLNPKVHKLKKLELKKGEKNILKKRHLFRANMSTRKLYTGEHKVEIQINGKIVKSRTFNLIT